MLLMVSAVARIRWPSPEELAVGETGEYVEGGGRGVTMGSETADVS